MVVVLANIVEICKRISRAPSDYQSQTIPVQGSPLCFPPARMHFWLLTARTSLPSSDFGSAVPRNIGLYWFIPYLYQLASYGGAGYLLTALTNSKESSSNGIILLLGQKVCSYPGIVLK